MCNTNQPQYTAVSSTPAHADTVKDTLLGPDSDGVQYTEAVQLVLTEVSGPHGNDGPCERTYQVHFQDTEGSAHKELDRAFRLCQSLRLLTSYAEQQYNESIVLANLYQIQLCELRQSLHIAHRRAGILQRVAGRGMMMGEMYDFILSVCRYIDGSCCTDVTDQSHARRGCSAVNLFVSSNKLSLTFQTPGRRRYTFFSFYRFCLFVCLFFSNITRGQRLGPEKKAVNRKMFSKPS